MNFYYLILFIFMINESLFCQEIKNPLISNDDKIVFGLVDITIEVNENDDVYKIEAFKTKDNDEILSRNNSYEFSKLAWVSIGYPKFVRNKRNKGHNIFHFTDNSVFAKISMLTNDYKKYIVDAIKSKYRVSVGTNQITTMSLSKFDCETSVFDKNNKGKMLHSHVRNFAKFPLELQFQYPKNSNEHQIFQNNPELHFDCVIKAGAAQKKSNVLTINHNQLNELRIIEDLFGPSSEVYVTRNQLTNLAFDIFTSLDIVEEYQIPEKDFNIKFVDDLITQIATNAFNQVSIDEVFKKFSQYSTSFDKDLTADVIKEDFGKLYQIKKLNDKKIIKLDEEHLNALKKKYGSENEMKADLNLKVPIIDISFGGQLASSGKKSNESDETNSKKSLDEQLKEINTENNDQIEFVIKGEKIIPKNIKVAKLNKNVFKKKLTFNRIRKESFDAIFERNIQLSTIEIEDNVELEAKSESIDELTKKIRLEFEEANKNKISLLHSDLQSCLKSHNHLINKIKILEPEKNDFPNKQLEVKKDELTYEYTSNYYSKILNSILTIFIF